ncbi:MAG: phosphotransferase family protein [Minisyncoccia bacterium]
MERQEIIEIAVGHSHDEVQSVEQITGKGQVNEISLVTTVTNAKYVLRADPNESTIERFNKEKWCMETAKAAGILVPEILDVSLTKNGQSYMLLSYVVGTNGQDTDPSSQKEIWRVLGSYAKKIHAFPVSGYGEKMVAPGEFEGSWLAYVDYNISSLNADDKLLSLNIITEAESAFLKSIFEQLKNTDFNFGLIHNDLSLKNTIVGPDGEVYLLDWGSAQVDVVPHMDFAEIAYSSLKTDSEDFRVFLDNYGMSTDAFNGIKGEMDRLQLLAFTDKVRWAIDRNSDLVEPKVAEFRGVLEKIKEV